MSIVKITQHQESVFDFEEKEEVKIPKIPMYRSKFTKHKEKSADHQWRHMHRDFGFPETPLNPPDKFLRKNSGIHHIYPACSSNRLCSARRPPIPKPDELQKTQSMQELPQEKNFKLINIKRAASSFNFQRKPPRFADTKHGDHQDLEKSGLLPIYIHKPKFGKVPKYLKKMKSQLTEPQDEDETHREDESEVEEGIRVISLEEKQELINGLQHNWDILQKEYQKLPLLTDTYPKMLRKTKLENSLKQLERDIVLLNSQQSCIYIKK